MIKRARRREKKRSTNKIDENNSENEIVTAIM